jgi:hypothetical protein
MYQQSMPTQPVDSRITGLIERLCAAEKVMKSDALISAQIVKRIEELEREVAEARANAAGFKADLDALRACVTDTNKKESFKSQGVKTAVQVCF